MGWVYFALGFTTAITLYSIVNSVIMYKAQKRKQEAAKAAAETDEAEFVKTLERAFGLEPKDEKKEEAKKIIKLVKDEDDEDPTLH